LLSKYFLDNSFRPEVPSSESRGSNDSNDLPLIITPRTVNVNNGYDVIGVIVYKRKGNLRGNFEAIERIWLPKKCKHLIF